MHDKLIKKALGHERDGQASRAEALYRKILGKQPNHLDALYLLGTLKAKLGDLDEAEAYLRRALDLNPRSVYVLNNLANVLKTRKEYAQAEALYTRILKIDPRLIEARINLAALCLQLDQLDRARTLFQEALKLKPDAEDALLGLAKCHIKSGDETRASELLRDITRAPSANPNVVSTLAELAWSAALTPERRHATLRHVESIIDTRGSTWPKSALAHVLFNLGRLREKCGEYDTAFAAYRDANKLSSRELDRAGYQRLVDGILAGHRHAPATPSPAASRDGPRPLFIVGMPRSGSTLVESIVSLSGDVQNLGESAAFPEAVFSSTPLRDLLSAGSQDALNEAQLAAVRRAYLAHWDGRSQTVVDKNLFNFYFVGSILRALPEARILHTKRDPLDTIVSCYGIDFSGDYMDFTFDLGDLGWYYHRYEQVMAYWSACYPEHVLTVPYEAVAEGDDGVIDRLFDFCGLARPADWQAFHRQKRRVGTASYRQVIRPLTNESVRRAAPFLPHLGPAIEALQGT